VTYYLIQPLTFTNGTTHAVSWSTTEPGGFTDGQVKALDGINAAFSRIAEIYGLKRLANNLLDADLGLRTGARVLQGQIKLGDGEDIRAIIWFSDLRGSTTLADSMPRGDFLAILNQFFECLAGAVIDNGGEVLRFIGDSVLAIFPITDDGASAADACETAIAAARDAAGRMENLNAERTGAGEDPLGFGIALHLGDVMYGNTGVPTRVEFSVIGAAANEAARLEGLCKTLGENLLVSADVMAHHPGPWRSLGTHKLRGVGADHEVFTLKT
jgi:adenylate cyclase